MDFGILRRTVAPLAAVALRSFALTVLSMVLLGLVLSGLSFYFTYERSTLYGVLAILLALLTCTVAGFMVAGQRAIAAALMRGLREYQLGGIAVRLLFDRLLGVTEQPEPDGRGAVVARAAERLPLAQAEARLSEAVTAILRAPDEGGGPAGWFRRKVQGKLLGFVKQYTLARFRQEGAEHGGIDLLKVRAELGQGIDGFLIEKVRSTAVRYTALVIAGAVLVVIVVTNILRQLPV